MSGNNGCPNDNLMCECGHDESWHEDTIIEGLCVCIVGGCECNDFCAKKGPSDAEE
ncbi:MAG TPA: hypothetical protein VK540_35600 [Polyangiaceae bacterium]|nr:hypothetical protein [Polyangiaceae bacterium]